MNRFKTLLVATAAAFSMAGAANAAALVEVATSGQAGPNQIVWDGTAPGEGNLTVSGISTIINFDDSIFNDGVFGQQAVLTMVAGTGGGGSLSQALPNFTQTGIDGYFEFRSLDLSTVLLRGDFQNYWITGTLNTPSGNLTQLGGGTLQLSSELVDLSWIKGDNSAWTFSNVSPLFGITNGQLNDFTGASLAGTFGGVVPEPGTWALMILGFGGAGAMIRARRRQAAFA